MPSWIATPQTFVGVSSALLAPSTPSPLDLQRSQSSGVAGCFDLEALVSLEVKLQLSCYISMCRANAAPPLAVSSCCEFFQKKGGGKKMRTWTERNFSFLSPGLRSCHQSHCPFYLWKQQIPFLSLLPLLCGCKLENHRVTGFTCPVEMKIKRIGVVLVYLLRSLGLLLRNYCCSFRFDHFLAATKLTLLFLFLL